MSISRVTSWSSGQVLTASALNDEFNNIINNALSLVSPLTANLSGGGNQITNTIFVPAALSGTPVQHALYQANVPKGWVVAGTDGVIDDSFNVSSLTDTATGALTITWDRDFATTDYGVFPAAQATVSSAATTIACNVLPASHAVGSCQIETRRVTDGVAIDPTLFYAFAFGDQ